MFPARIAIATALEEVQGANGGNCNVFQAKLKLFGKASASNPSSLPLNDITNQTFEVLHPGTNTISVNDQVIVGQTIDERWIVMPSGTSTGSGHPRIQFVTTGKISNRRVNAKVLRVQSNAPDLVNGGLLAYGAQVTLNDPFNLWSDIEEGATGWAYLAYQQQDNTETENIDEEHTIRYEIEECTLPIKRIEGKLLNCLYQGQTAKVMVDIDEPSLADRNTIRSSYPNVDMPPADEFTEETTEGSNPITYKYVTALNQFNLDAIAGSKVVIERITNKRASDPENYTTPLARSADNDEWQVVQVEKKYARHIKVRKQGDTQGSGFTKTDHYDGFWPPLNAPPGEPLDTTQCSPTITCDYCECLEEGDEAYAFFDSNTGNYKVYSTKSAFYGPADDVTLVTESIGFDGCTLNYQRTPAKVLCKLDPVAGNTSLPVQTVTVSTGSTIGIQECEGTCAWRWGYPTNPCVNGGQCTWEWDAFVEDWARVDGDPSCPTGCDCQPPPQPADPANTPHGTAGGTTDCVTEDTNASPGWQKIRACSGDCDCPQPAIPSPSPVVGTETTTGCDADGDGDGTKELCVTSTLSQITVVACAGQSVTLPTSSSQQTCIPIETECPDVCEAGTETP